MNIKISMVVTCLKIYNKCISRLYITFRKEPPKGFQQYTNVQDLNQSPMAEDSLQYVDLENVTDLI